MIDALTVKAENHIARLHTSFLGRTPLFDRTHQRTFGLAQTEGFGQRLIDLLHRYAQTATRDLAMLQQLLFNLHGYINRNRERQTLIAAGLDVDLRIDANHIALQIEQRTARIAGIDGDVGLNERHVIVVRQTTRLGADDTGRSRIVKAIGRADRQHWFTYLEQA